MYAPIIIFAFNRLEPLKRCVASLAANSEAVETDMIVYVDGPRTTKEGESEKVAAVKEYVKSVTGFKSLTYHFSSVNKKLGPSIIAGVTEVINQHGKAIVIEDDLVVSRNFLAFINQGLNAYEDNDDIISICGYSNIVKVPNEYQFDAYLCPRSSSWGWATWKNRWNSIDWDLNDWISIEKNARAFNKWGGSDCFGMLDAWHKGLNQSWAIRFCYNQFVQNKLSLFPVVSKVDNEGFDGEGTNCKKWSRFKFELDHSENKNFTLPNDMKVVPLIRKSFLSYSTIWIRIYSRLMYLIYR